MNMDANLDYALKRSVPQAETPPALHGSIMHALRAAGQPLPPARTSPFNYWLAAPVLALVLGALWTWHVASKPAPARTAFESAGTALATSEAMARAVPDTALAPLNDEWQRVNQDLHNTADFLLATLP
jgi:hypothetical protein